MSGFVTHVVAAVLGGAMAAHDGPTPQPATDLVGTWRVENNAEIIVVEASQATFFDATSRSCLQTERGPAAILHERFPGGVVARTATSATLADRTGFLYYLTRIDALPDPCREGGATEGDPVLDFEAFIAYFEENYAGTDARDLDWAKLRDRYRPRISASTSEEELWAIYAEILASFDDVHVFLSNGKQGGQSRSLSAGRPSGLRKALLLQDPGLQEDDGFARDAEVAPALNQVILYDVLRGRYSSALQDKFQWGWAAPGVGYLNIRQMGGLFEAPATDPDAVEAAVRQTMAKVLRDLGGARALIVDVRANRGGSSAVGYAIASFFIDRPITLKGRTRTPAGFTDWQATVVEPDKDLRFSAPVYLLVSDNTVSAAEEFAMVMREVPGVTLVGTKTRGALSSILVKKMPGGGMIGVANEQRLSPGGEDFEAVGVPAEIPAESFRPDCLFACFAEPVRVALRAIERTEGVSADTPR